MEGVRAGLKNIHITIHKDLLEASKGLLTLGVILSKVGVQKLDQDLWDLLQKAGEKQQKEHEADQIENVEQIKALRDTYKNLGLRLSDYKGSNEALLRRILSKKGLYQINTVVDINNYISVESLRSVGSYDLSQLVGDITFRRGLSNEKYIGTTNRSMVLKNLPVLCDDKGPFGSPTSDSNRALIKETTSEVLTVIYSFDGPNFLEEQMLKVQDLLKTHAQAKDVSMFVVKQEVELKLEHPTLEEEKKETPKYRVEPNENSVTIIFQFKELLTGDHHSDMDHLIRLEHLINLFKSRGVIKNEATKVQSKFVYDGVVLNYKPGEYEQIPETNTPPSLEVILYNDHCELIFQCTIEQFNEQQVGNLICEVFFDKQLPMDPVVKRISLAPLNALKFVGIQGLHGQEEVIEFREKDGIELAYRHQVLTSDQDAKFFITSLGDKKYCSTIKNWV